jgi:hypothetical protein
MYAGMKSAFMPETDQQLREYLLGSRNPSSERAIEENLLTEDREFERLRSVEDELVDDYVFGYLSSDEQARFEHHFLCTPERKRKVELSRAICIFAADRAAGRVSPFGRFWRFWALPQFRSYGWQAATLCLTVFVCTWVAVQNHRLRSELSFLQQSTIASRAAVREAAANPVQSIQATTVAQSAGQSATVETGGTITIDALAIVLTPGSTRSVGEQARLQLAPAISSVQITLRVAYPPKGELQEQLLNAEGDNIWSQRIMASRSEIDSQGVKILMPASLLQPDDYRILLSTKTRSGKFDEIAHYSFRVKGLESR